MYGSVELQNSHCAKCPALCKSRTQVVNGKGNTNAKIMFVSEWPGSPEDRSGDIWSGPIGEEFNSLLRKAGIDRGDVYLTTAVRCLPRTAPTPENRHGTRKPSVAEVEACMSYLDLEIAAIRPNVIVPMGTIATKSVFAHVATIGDTRGTEQWSYKHQCKVMPIYHPLVIRNTPEYEGFTVEDLKRIKVSAAYPELTPKELGQYLTVDTLKKFDQVMERLLSVDRFAYDSETTGTDHTKDLIFCLSFSWKVGTGVVIPIRRWVRKEEEIIEIKKRKIRKKNKVTKLFEVVGEKDVPKPKKVYTDTYEPYWGEHQGYILRRIAEVLRRKDVTKVTHNGAFDDKFLLVDLGIFVEGPHIDTMHRDFMVDENAEGMHGLKDCAWRYTKMGGYEDPLEKWFKDHNIADGKRNYAQVPTEIMYYYSAADPDCTLRVDDALAPKMVADNLLELERRLMLPTRQNLMEMEIAGVLLDKEYYKFAKEKLEFELLRREHELQQAVGKRTDAKTGKLVEYNFNSNKQMQNLFYVVRKHPITKHTKEGDASLDEEVLDEIAKKDPIAKMVKEYRQVRKFLSQYIEGLMERVDANGILHTTFLLHGAVTGRLSSANPNLQNIQKDPVFVQTAEKRYAIYVKRMFIARPGYMWIEADFGQAEFRHWANYSQDQDMIRDIKAADDGTGPDIHKRTASEAWGVPIEKVDKKLRDKAKRVVFGIMYGRQADSIAEEVGITIQEAQKIIDIFLSRYPVARAWLRKAITTVEQYGQIRNTFGRLRRLSGIRSRIEYIRSERERLAMNSPIQSVASDMNCNAANRIRVAFKQHSIDGGLRILVHDAIYAEVAIKDLDRGLRIMQEEMERPMAGITVPMRAEFKVGKCWGKVKKPKVALRYAKWLLKYQEKGLVAA